MSPKKGPFQKERVVFQLLFFRGHVMTITVKSADVFPIGNPQGFSAICWMVILYYTTSKIIVAWKIFHSSIHHCLELTHVCSFNYRLPWLFSRFFFPSKTMRVARLNPPPGWFWRFKWVTFCYSPSLTRWLVQHQLISVNSADICWWTKSCKKHIISYPPLN